MAVALAEEVEADMAAEEVEATGVGVEVTGAAGASGSWRGLPWRERRRRRRVQAAGLRTPGVCGR